MQNLEVTFDFMNEFWQSGQPSDHPSATDMMRDWSREGLLSRAVNAGVVMESKVSLKGLSEEERTLALHKIEQELEKDLTKSGPHRKEAWEEGWKDSLTDFRTTRTKQSLTPGYFERSNIVRLKDELFQVATGESEAILLGFLVDLIVETSRQLYSFENIHEFGCGTGIHVRRLAKRYKAATVTGYDWATSSQELVNEIRESEGLANLRARNFDFFSPDPSVDIGAGDAVLTVAALEQTGSSFGLFLDTLISKRPKLVINIEPIEELLDTTTQLGLLSAEYFRKRNYLSGFFQALVDKEASEELTILHSGRSGLGSLFIEGYSIVVWSPRR